MGGLLVALSGIDGAGKSTQISLLSEKFDTEGVPYVYLWTRGGNTPGVTFIKSFLRRFSPLRLPPPGRSEGRTKMLAKPRVQILWLIAAILELCWIYGIFVRWQTFRGRLVLCDRYLADTLIDFKVMFPQQEVEVWMLWKFLVKITPAPAASFFLKIPLDTSFERCLVKYEPFPDTDEEKRTRYNLYVSHFTEDKATIIDGTGNKADICAQILGAIFE